MDIVLMILYVSILLGFLVLIHEGGHYLASCAFGVRVTEFMIGFPGPGIGFTKWGTKFGVTCVPLGGYAKVSRPFCWAVMHACAVWSRAR